MEVVNTLDIDGTQWELQDVEARNKITVLEKNFNSLANYQKDIEINTGAKWIDGKPIYRQVFYSPTGWSNNQLLGNIKNLHTVINIISTSKNINGNWFTNFTIAGTDNSCYVSPDGSIRIVRTGYFLNNLESVVIVEYTKTTN